MVHRWFGDQIRTDQARHWGMTFHEWYRMKFYNQKRRNPFVKRPWLLRDIDRYGRPKNHPLYQKPKISD
jgi:hypothetical protein